MVERQRGHIVNIASASSFQGVALMTSYAASKWAVLGFSESLIYELQLDGHPIQVTSVCPGYIDTGMFDGANPPWIMPFLKPSDVAEAVVRGIQNNERTVLMPPIVKAVPLMKLLPNRLTDFLAHKLGINRSMEEWKGH
jgi:all-trans-retinol dehydrogenase (NAD+)